MYRPTLALCWLILTIWLVPAFAQRADRAGAALQGSWIATRAERDGKPAHDVVGHRLSVAANRFQIRSKDGKSLYAGTVRVEQVAIDFEHTEGTLSGQAWKGIYAVNGDTLLICDNAPDIDKIRPATFEAKTGSGYVVVTFVRAKP
jgi:uncharacterized protein (TIGR03067 family)